MKSLLMTYIFVYSTKTSRRQTEHTEGTKFTWQKVAVTHEILVPTTEMKLGCGRQIDKCADRE